MASSSTSLLFSIFTHFFILCLATSSEDNIPDIITIPLTPRFSKERSTDPWVFLQKVASAAMSRAHYMKYGKTNPRIGTSLFPEDGVHTISLKFGTPPQKISFLVDTGSDIVWSPCTTQFTCVNCSVPSQEFHIFDPKLSSSSKILQCRSPKCVDGCPSCNTKSKNCSRSCPFRIEYATGEASGYYLLENLKFPKKTFHDFLLGCSTFAANDPSTDSLAGFGRTAVSLPVQMGAKKFAYCLKSHDYDFTGNSSKLIFDYSDGETKGLSYVPFVKNPPGYEGFYYLGIEDIMVEDKLLGIPSKYMIPGSDGNGGVVIDSGFTYGYMARPIHKLVLNELKKQMSKYRRSPVAEASSKFTPCYNLTGQENKQLPDLVYKFTSGAKLVVPAKNYFHRIESMETVCFPINTDPVNSSDFSLGPSIILGNYQHVDYYVEFDLKNDRFGFRPETC